MMNREYMKQTYADNLTAWREYRAQIAQDAETLCEIVQKHRFSDSTPEQAAREIVQAIGAENARVIIASAVNAHKGDGRLSAAVIEWAQGIGWDWEMTCNLGLTLDSKMHMCHINQTAEALMNLPEDEPEQPETEPAEADETETETNEQERNIMHEADMEAIEGGYAAAKKYEAAGNRLKEILNDPTQHRYLDRAQEQYTTATRRYDAWCDLQDALKEIDRHGYCYILALIIVKYGKAEQIIRFIMRKAKSICEDEHITLYNNPRIAPQTITMWAINQYGGLLTQADMDAAIAWRKQCLTIRTKKGA